jgi:hypothetical protein
MGRKSRGRLASSFLGSRTRKDLLIRSRSVELLWKADNSAQTDSATRDQECLKKRGPKPSGLGLGRRVHAPNGSVDFIMREGGV